MNYTFTTYSLSNLTSLRLIFFLFLVSLFLIRCKNKAPESSETNSARSEDSIQRSQEEIPEEGTRSQQQSEKKSGHGTEQSEKGSSSANTSNALAATKTSSKMLELPISSFYQDIPVDDYISDRCTTFYDIHQMLMRQFLIPPEENLFFTNQKSLIMTFPLEYINLKGRLLPQQGPKDCNGFAIRRKLMIVVSNLPEDSVEEVDYGDNVLTKLQNFGGKNSTYPGKNLLKRYNFNENTLFRVYGFIIYNKVNKRQYYTATDEENSCHVTLLPRYHTIRALNLVR